MCAAVDLSGSSPTTEDMAVQGTFADVVDGNAAESMAEAEGLQDIPLSAATADVSGSFRLVSPCKCLIACLLMSYGLLMYSRHAH